MTSCGPANASYPGVAQSFLCMQCSFLAGFRKSVSHGERQASIVCNVRDPEHGLRPNRKFEPLPGASHAKSLTGPPRPWEQQPVDDYHQIDLTPSSAPCRTCPAGATGGMAPPIAAAILASGALAMPSRGTTQSVPCRRALLGTPYAATRLRTQVKLSCHVHNLVLACSHATEDPDQRDNCLLIMPTAVSQAHTSLTWAALTIEPLTLTLTRTSDVDPRPGLSYTCESSNPDCTVLHLRVVGSSSARSSAAAMSFSHASASPFASSCSHRGRTSRKTGREACLPSAASGLL